MTYAPNLSADPPPEKMGRRERTKIRNREAILSAAKIVFAEKGYEAATVRDIIGRTELASGTFYNYFRSKDEIATALASDAAQKLRPLLQSHRRQAGGIRDYFDGIVGAYFQFLIDEYGSVGPGHVMRPPNVNVVTPAQRAIFEEVRDAIVLALGEELASSADVDYITAAATGIARNVGIQMLYRKPPNPQEAAKFAVQLIMDGLGAVTSKSTP